MRRSPSAYITSNHRPQLEHLEAVNCQAGGRHVMAAVLARPLLGEGVSALSTLAIVVALAVLAGGLVTNIQPILHRVPSWPNSLLHDAKEPSHARSTFR
jgi:hypothetical protein